MCPVLWIHLKKTKTEQYKKPQKNETHKILVSTEHGETAERLGEDTCLVHAC